MDGSKSVPATVCDFELWGRPLKFMITAMQTENLIIGRIGRVELRFIAIRSSFLRYSLHHTDGNNVRLESIFWSSEYMFFTVAHSAVENYLQQPNEAAVDYLLQNLSKFTSSRQAWKFLRQEQVGRIRKCHYRLWMWMVVMRLIFDTRLSVILECTKQCIGAVNLCPGQKWMNLLRILARDVFHAK